MFVHATVVMIPVGQDVCAYDGVALHTALLLGDTVPFAKGRYQHMEVSVNGGVDPNCPSIENLQCASKPGRGTLPDGVTIQDVREVMRAVFANKISPSSEIGGERAGGIITILAYCDEGF